MHCIHSNNVQILKIVLKKENFTAIGELLCNYPLPQLGEMPKKLDFVQLFLTMQEAHMGWAQV